MFPLIFQNRIIILFNLKDNRYLYVAYHFAKIGMITFIMEPPAKLRNF
ncbi:MAG: hypothetical protein BAJALOKI1v1_860004 [Promethearchaeota archaeon]|nr:MAG: hypothetical protein BAJALOKI1v1_860004 [Candidatus Lokiarchaeota archaeon]